MLPPEEKPQHPGRAKKMKLIFIVVSLLAAVVLIAIQFRPPPQVQPDTSPVTLFMHSIDKHVTANEYVFSRVQMRPDDHGTLLVSGSVRTAAELQTLSDILAKGEPKIKITNQVVVRR